MKKIMIGFFDFFFNAALGYIMMIASFPDAPKYIYTIGALVFVAALKSVFGKWTDDIQ